jgi:hypothetical protein
MPEIRTNPATHNRKGNASLIGSSNGRSVRTKKVWEDPTTTKRTISSPPCATVSILESAVHRQSSFKNPMIWAATNQPAAASMLEQTMPWQPEDALHHTHKAGLEIYGMWTNVASRGRATRIANAVVARLRRKDECPWPK